jgi:serine/threonine protein kinase
VHDIAELFTLSKLVGKGGFAEVWLGRSRGNGRLYAVITVSVIDVNITAIHSGARQLSSEYFVDPARLPVNE